MKKFLLSAFSCVLALGAAASGIAKPAAAANRAALRADGVTELTMNYLLTSLYDDKSSKVPNFYLIMSDSPNAKYDPNTGTISAPGGSYALMLDLYNYRPDDAIYVPAGTYTMLEEEELERAFTYTHEFSMLNYYDPNKGALSIQLENPVDIERADNGRYTISTLVNDGNGNLTRVTYNGPITFTTSNERPTVYPQITHDITANLNKGGISFYQGVTDISSQGVSYLDLYDVDFDKSNGVMAGEGYNLCMMIAHKRFTKRELYAVCPGTYVEGTSLKRDTWYPGREIDYMGYVMYYGSYIRQLTIENGERNYTYAYLKSGEFTIEDNGDGTYKGTLDAITSLGYTVNLTWSGAITLNTDNATFTATISDLVDDVELDFTNLEKGRIYHNGIQGGCRTLIVDLGSPSGKDPGINNGGDLLRMEFLVDPKEHLLQPGLYTVVPRRWNRDELHAGGTYEPMSLNKGYFDATGDQIGTRYAHFAEGRDRVYDMVGPAEEGNVRVETDDYENYKFDIDLMDDAGFKIFGKWDKPIEYNYDADALKAEIDASVTTIGADDSNITAVIEGSDLFVINAGNAPMMIFSADGRLVASTTADKVIPVSSLGKGMFVISVKNKSIKIVL